MMTATLSESRRRYARIALLAAVVFALCAGIASAIDMYATGGSITPLALSASVMAMAGLCLAVIK
jgi:hypothetical protein